MVLHQRDYNWVSNIAPSQRTVGLTPPQKALAARESQAAREHLSKGDRWYSQPHVSTNVFFVRRSVNTSSEKGCWAIYSSV